MLSQISNPPAQRSNCEFHLSKISSHHHFATFTQRTHQTRVPHKQVYAVTSNGMNAEIEDYTSNWFLAVRVNAEASRNKHSLFCARFPSSFSLPVHNEIPAVEIFEIIAVRSNYELLQLPHVQRTLSFNLPSIWQIITENRDKEQCVDPVFHWPTKKIESFFVVCTLSNPRRAWWE